MQEIVFYNVLYGLIKWTKATFNILSMLIDWEKSFLMVKLSDQQTFVP